MTARPSSGSLTNAPGVRRPSWSGATSAIQTTSAARAVSAAPMPVRTTPCARCAAASRVRSGRHASVPGVAVDPQPRDVAAERLGEQRERDEQGDLGHDQRQDVGSGDRQHDPLRRRDDLAPVARRKLLAEPRKQPPGREERVARRADREHPGAGRAGDEHAEDENQERVDLAVELRTQWGRRSHAPDDPSVDCVQHERDDRERHEQRDLGGLVERVRDQRRDGDRERRPRQCHPVGRAQPLGAVAREAARQSRIHDHCAADSDAPAGTAETDASRERGEQQRLGDQPGDRPGVSRPHRSSAFDPNRLHRRSAFVCLWGSTGRTANRFPLDLADRLGRARS